MPPSPEVMFLVGYSENIANDPKVPTGSAVERRAVRLGRVLEDLEAVLVGDLPKSRHVGGMAVEVDRHDRRPCGP